MYATQVPRTGTAKEGTREDYTNQIEPVGKPRNIGSTGKAGEWRKYGGGNPGKRMLPREGLGPCVHPRFTPKKNPGKKSQGENIFSRLEKNIFKKPFFRERLVGVTTEIGVQADICLGNNYIY